MEKTILVVAEHSHGKIKPVTYEAVACARKLQTLEQTPIKALILGEEIAEPAQALARTTRLNVVAIKVDGLSHYNGEAYLAILSGIVSDFRASYVVCGGTANAADFAPALAVRIHGGCISGVQRVFEEAGKVRFARSMFGGKVVADLVSHAETTIITVQPGLFKAGEPDGRETGSVELRTVSFAPHRSRTLGTKCADIGHSGLEDAEAIVAAGRGIGNEENLHLIERLASLLPRSAIAGSRPVCDAGWLEYKQQVGMTGATVSPKLYLACGISGSVQHLCGMRGAEFIVAINKDPNAAIFNESDVCVVEDLATFLPTLIDRLERGNARATKIT